MQVVGYVREAPGPQEGDSAFAQSERIRRWATDQGHQIVAVCQDVRTPGYKANRDGLRALIGIVGAGRVTAVVVASLAAFSADKVVQEVMLDDLRRRGVTVISTEEADTASLEDPPADRERLFIRDVLARAWEQQELIAGPGDAPVLRIAEGPGDPGLIIELVPADEDPESPEASSPPPEGTTTRR